MIYLDSRFDEFFEEKVFDTRKEIVIEIPSWIENLFSIFNKDKERV